MFMPKDLAKHAKKEKDIEKAVLRECAKITKKPSVRQALPWDIKKELAR